MFDNRAAEDLRLGGGRQGFLDLYFENLRNSEPARRLAAAAGGLLSRLLRRPAAVSVCLGQGRTASFLADGRCRIDAIKGRVWVTAQGVMQDYALGEGGRLELPGGRQVVVTAMEGEARVAIRWR